MVVSFEALYYSVVFYCAHRLTPNPGLGLPQYLGILVMVDAKHLSTASPQVVVLVSITIGTPAVSTQHIKKQFYLPPSAIVSLSLIDGNILKLHYYSRVLPT